MLVRDRTPSPGVKTEMPLTFEEFQDLILKHPILGDSEWEFSYVQDGIQCPHYRAIQPKRHILCLHLRLEVIYPCAKDEWRVHYYHQGHGKTLDEALKSFFSMDRKPRSDKETHE